MTAARQATAVTVIDYRLHFRVLGVSAALLCALVASLAQSSLGSFTGFFGVIGAIHSTALVLALRRPASWGRRLLFIGIAITLSIAAPLVGFSSARVMRVPQFWSFHAAIFLASAFGAAAYWIVVRWMWLPRLAHESAFTTSGLCAVGSVCAFQICAILTGYGSRSSLLADMIPTVVWWSVFSATIFFAERSASVGRTDD